MVFNSTKVMKNDLLVGNEELFLMLGERMQFQDHGKTTIENKFGFQR